MDAIVTDTKQTASECIRHLRCVMSSEGGGGRPSDTNRGIVPDPFLTHTGSNVSVSQISSPCRASKTRYPDASLFVSVPPSRSLLCSLFEKMTPSDLFTLALALALALPHSFAAPVAQ